MIKKRKSEIKRVTRETNIAVSLNLDGNGKSRIDTGIGFLDHMLTLFAKHGFFDIKLKAKGDLNVDTHHTNEDVGICLGEAFKKALGKKARIRRYGYSFVPMDEALAHARVVLDISGRPSLSFNSKVKKIAAAAYTLQDAKEFLKAFSTNAGINMHVDALRGEDTHHIIEALFKAAARAMREAVSIDPRGKGVPSTKGRL
ncbi:MAG: imidazoleglycerol-phosphate dehydratase HisB [Candidatus Omnitrophica bacterium]|nr:imidazoleglycerol-phosphate dehydratase HisB [Candidatus Omnitrophota bacterium]